MTLPQATTFISLLLVPWTLMYNFLCITLALTTVVLVDIMAAPID